MKKIVKFLVALALVFVVGCTTQKNVEEVVFGTSMMVTYTMDVTEIQVDSICKADMLPNYDKWIKSSFTDYETNQVFVKRLYIKNGEYEVVYILTGDREPYKITRRITE